VHSSPSRAAKTCRVYPYPPPAVWNAEYLYRYPSQPPAVWNAEYIPLHRLQCGMQSISLSIACSVGVKDVFSPPVSSADVHFFCVFLFSFVQFFLCRIDGLSGLRSVRYRKENYYPCRNQSGTEIWRPSLVPECSCTYRTELPDTGMPMESTSMPMPRYATYLPKVGVRLGVG